VNTHSGEWPKVFTFDQNRCSRSVRIAVHVRPERVFTLLQNMHQAEAGQVPDMRARSFRRCYWDRYEADGLQGLNDRRLDPVSNRRARVDEVMALTMQYHTRHNGWNVRHFVSV
jgi:hypothetical protein